MKRPLFLLGLFLAIGIAAAYISGSYLFVIMSAIAALIPGVAFFGKYPGRVRIFAACMAFYALGGFEYLYIDNANREKFADYIGKEVTIRGTVAGDPDIKESRVSYIIKIDEIMSNEEKRWIKGKILLNTLKNKETRAYKYGQELIFRGRLNAPKGKRNPGGFDYRGYLAQSGISATIFSRNDNIAATKRVRINPIVKLGLELRNRIINVVNKSLPQQQAGLLNGMLIGYRGGLSEEVEQAFSDSGLTHLMAVSGANIAFIMMPLIFIFKKMRIKQKIANCFLIGILILFVFVTGFSPSVLRAAIMAITVLIGQILRRETDVIASISLAAILLLIYNPGTLFNIGFQLSFAATFSLVLMYKGIKEWLSFRLMPVFLADVLAATLAAQAGVLPITAYYFNKVSIISVVSNILVVPVTQVITILGFLMAVLGQVNIIFSQFIGYINSTFLTFVLYVCKLSAQIPFAAITVVTPPVMGVGIYYLVLFFVIKFRETGKFKPNLKHYAAAFSVMLLVLVIYFMRPAGLEVVFIDVGQGDSAFIRTYKGTTVLIDGGGYTSGTDSRSNTGETVVIPFLMDYGVSKIDLVVATHGHDDHIGGLVPVLEQLGIDNFIIPDCTSKKEFDELIKIAYARGIKVKACSRGEVINLDDKTSLYVLHPPRGFSAVDSSLNNTSLVIKLVYGNTSVLFTGDIEEEAENMLVTDAVNVKSMVLKIPHHGSSTSASSGFLEAVNPKAAVISVGDNYFGHPSERVIKELEKNKISIFRTDQNGAVILFSDGKNIKLKSMIKVKK